MFEDIDLKVGEEKSGQATMLYTDACSTYTKSWAACGHTTYCTESCCTDWC